MPQKENPVGPSAMVALARQVIGLVPLLQGAGLHRQQRDGAAWFTEWLTLPQLCISASRLLTHAEDCLARLSPNPGVMARPLTEGLGLIHAEALTFALAGAMPRPEAQALVSRLCKEAQATGISLLTLAESHLPQSGVGFAQSAAALGSAPDEARAFAAQARMAV